MRGSNGVGDDVRCSHVGGCLPAWLQQVAYKEISWQLPPQLVVFIGSGQVTIYVTFMNL
ncbi:hypothetical protein WN944_001775 [Citrus x changshan-huyou]|uniref:Uncharacterized protein n=1 Tax=Citrus x changshan-huyou TaxID=2935761 RepID=A0AAP0QMZ4_9ROSI